MINGRKLLSCALTVGENMLTSGAEVGRVEDTVTRICRAYGAKHVNVLTITSSIVASAVFEDDKSVTETRRITKQNTNFERLDYLNSLSREICSEKPEIAYIEKKLDELKDVKDFSFAVHCLAWAVAAGAFTVFFGGSLKDGLISAIIGVLLKLSVCLAKKGGINLIFVNIFASFVCTSAAYAAVRLGLGQSADKIIIGNIMLLIPGIVITNSIRDMITGDTITGTLRFFEACLTALAIAGGYSLTVFVFGGVI